ncbi:hypothetical protein QWA68_015255 [Fusarium oxysporum]|nr:hypothetical protein QWA68_015255 [Fusarium oxysporum]
MTPLEVVVGILALTLPSGAMNQQVLGASSSGLGCELSPPLDPSHDGLPSADSLFSTLAALETQVRRHQAIVQVPSICYDDMGDFDTDVRWAPFYDLHQTLAKTYPNLHDFAKVEKVNRFGLLYTLEGYDASLKPTLLAAHQDVVPVANDSTWTYPPFAAHYDGLWLWGRGASDDKNSMTALLSSVETLLSDTPWKPRRTLLLAFGFDEECAGYRGAAQIGKLLLKRYGGNGIAVILDEGSSGLELIDNNTLYALPAVQEKGYVDIWLDLHVHGGHSSMPPPHTGIGIMSEIVTTLEENPYQPRLVKNAPAYKHLVCLARHNPDVRPGLADLLERDDLQGLAAALAEISPTAYLGTQTTQAVDFIRGGQKINAMPEEIKLGVNYRVAPQDGIVKVQYNVFRHISDIAEKHNLKVEAFKEDESYQGHVQSLLPSYGQPRAGVDYNGTILLYATQLFQVTGISPTNGSVWDVFSGTIRHTFASEGRNVVPVGEGMTANTDTRHYLDLSPNIYRWTPCRDGGTMNIHTDDERVKMSDHMEMVMFYYNFVRNFDAAFL